MMALTHAAFSCTGVALVMGTSDPGLLLAAALASQLPDCDIKTSYAGRLLVPFSWFIQQHFAHRTITHSFLGTAIVALLAAPLLSWNVLYYQAVVWGFFFGWMGDAFTKTGVAAFYPSRAKLGIPPNRKLRLSTGSPAEANVFFILCAILIFTLNVNSDGGVWVTFSRSLGHAEDATHFYLHNCNRNLIVATLKGHHPVTGDPISGKFEVVDIEGTELIVATPNGLLKTGADIKPTWITTDKEVAISVITKELNLLQESPADVMSSLTNLPPRTYVSGQLKLEDAEDLILPTTLAYYPTITAAEGLGASLINLKDATPFDVIDALRDYDATGTLFVRLVYVEPQQTSDFEQSLKLDFLKLLNGLYAPKD